MREAICPLRTGICEDKAVRRKIDTMCGRNMFKHKPIAAFKWNVE